MKYFLDTEFIEGFHKPLFGKRRHFIDLISIGIVCEDGRGLYLLSSEYNYDDADQWVRANVLHPAYINSVSGDARNSLYTHNFHKHFGLPVKDICNKVLEFIYPSVFKNFKGAESEFYQRTKDYGWGDNVDQPRFYGYYADYDWVLFCSMFGRMIDLPKGFPMYCRDIKQMMDELGVDSNHPDCPIQRDTHIAIHDAAWNREAYNWLQTLSPQNPTK